MSTPAVNRHITITEPHEWCSRTLPSGTETCSVRSIQTVIWDDEVRPASSTVPITKGWRKCAPWNHSGRYYTFRCADNLRTIVNTTTGAGTQFRYKDGSFWQGVTPPGVGAVPNGIKNRAEQAALLKLKSQDIHLGNFLAEFGKTAQMFVGTATVIASGVRRFRRSNPKELWDLIKKWERGNLPREFWHCIPSGWLQLQYGWLPLMSDVFGACNALSKGDRLPLAHVKGYAEDTTIETVNFSSVDGSSNGTLQSETLHKCWVSLYYQLKNPVLAELSSLGLINPVEIVWELLPYSFVVDWFLPIGNWLSSLTADVGFTFQGGSMSTSSKQKGCEVKRIQWEDSTGGGNHVFASGGQPNLSGSAYNFVRSCYSSSPVPGLYVKNPFSPKHIANALALLVQAFR